MRNEFSYMIFKQRLESFGVFSIQDILKIFPNFDSRRLNEWQNKNYLSKLIKGWYVFSDIKISENTLYQMSNALRSPSYISLQSALSFYNIIPEQSFAITAITTLKTQEYHTSKGRFIYKSIKPDYYFGYNILSQSQGRPVLMAELEKVLLDTLYLQQGLNSEESMNELRLNKELLKKSDFKKMEKYLKLFNNKALNNRYEILKKYVQC